MDSVERFPIERVTEDSRTGTEDIVAREFHLLFS